MSGDILGDIPDSDYRFNVLACNVYTMKPRETDILFSASTDVGFPECACSRCGVTIHGFDPPRFRLYMMLPGERELSTIDSLFWGEYRFCQYCIEWEDGSAEGNRLT